MSLNNVSTIKSIYAAFGRGDVAAIAEASSEDTRWDFAASYPDQVPWHTPVEGRSAVPEFFRSFATNVDVTAVEPGDFTHCGPHVIVPIRLAYQVKKTGKVVDMTQIHWWTFDDSGRVRQLRHWEDSAQVLSAISTG